MKRLFSRFSTTGPNPPSTADQGAFFNQSEKQDIRATKPVSALRTPKSNTIGRTRGLIAKFEGQPPDQSFSTQASYTTPQHSSPAPPADSTNSHAPADLSSKDSTTSTARSVPKRVPGSSLPERTTSIVSSPASSANVDKPVAQTIDTQPSPCQTSSDSPTAASIAQPSRAVAFAPSPQKQRPTSPARITQPQHLTASQPIARTASVDSDSFAGGSSFARPTAASQARSKQRTRSATGDTTEHVSTSSRRERGSTSFTRSTKPNYAPSSSSRPAARRSLSYSSGPDTRNGNLLSAALSIGNHAGASRISMERASPSIDTVVDHSRPLDFPSRMSLPMRKSYSGDASIRPGSRRNSVDPASPTGSSEPVVFPPTVAAASRSFGFPTWSEMTHEDLVRNLGPRERTRQEVLWEIVASEERYVTELERAKEIYMDALLHPEHFNPERVLPPASTTSFTASPIENLGSSEWSLVPQLAPSQPVSSIAGSPVLKADTGSRSNGGGLPIAAQFMSDAAASRSTAGSPLIRTIQSPDGSQPSRSVRSPYSARFGSVSSSDNVTPRSVPTNTRLDPAFGLGLGLGTTATKDRSAAAYMNTPSTSKEGKLSKAQKLRGLSLKTAGDANPLRLTVPLPPSLREVLIAISDALVEAHGLLSDALKARYEEQWPLVRSLADVFMKHSHILQNYASYVCHLQRAMEELEEAALMERAFRGKRLKKERLSNTVGLGRTVAALEACAAEQGYAGLMIFVSMPFQRLLKYPLLFQNLLFHTDPSTHEFESTVAMVVEVEQLVRSIEDEKVNAEERDKIRDAFARIDGIVDQQVLRPRPDRILIEEKALFDEHARRTLSESAPKNDESDAGVSDSEGGESGAESSDPGGRRWRSSKQLGLRATLRGKRSYRRLSDFLSSDEAARGTSKAPAMGSKKDLWVVRFSDVELKCQRIGVTALPMVSSAALRTDDVERKEDDLAARSKESRERLKALRSTTLRAKTRNLYKFISVVAWRHAAARAAEDEQRGFMDGLPTSHEVDETEEEDDASVSSDGDSSVSGSSSSGSSGGVGGQAGSEKYIRSTKLSFTYWGDRIEPGRTVAGPQPTAKGQLKKTVKDGVRSLDAAVRGTTASTDTPSLGIASTSDTQAPRQARKSTLDSRIRHLHSSQGRSGISGRLSEPLATTSISSAPVPVQSAVAQMHASQRNEKFGSRLRSSMANDAGMAHTGGKGGSQVSVDLPGEGVVKGNALNGVGGRKSGSAMGVGRAM